jgi:lysozyme family protein
MTFEEALSHVLRHEGGYVNNPADPGGETNYGITVAVARTAGYQGDMRSIPMDLVQKIYRRDYWEKAKCDQLPASVRLIHFDSAVNSGVTRASKWLQTAAGATSDGIIGPNTLRAIAVSERGLALRYAALRLTFLANLGAFSTFGKGWVRRVADVMAHSG